MEYKNNLDKQYIELISYVLEKGYTSSDRTGTGTKKVFGKLIEHNMSDGFPLLTSKKMFVKGILHELLWFLKGDTNIKYLVDNDVYIWVGDCYKKYKEYASNLNEPDYDVHIEDINQNCVRILTEKEFIDRIKSDTVFASKWGELNKVYGSEWVNWDDSINQVQEVIDTLHTNPDSRRMMVTAWNPTNVRNALLPPCHFIWQVFTRELTLDERKALVPDNTPNLYTHLDCDSINLPKREISLLFNMRSVDMPLGWPFDIASYGFLLSMLAQVVNMVPGELKCMLADTHIYLNQIDGCNELINRNTHVLPKIKLNKDVKNIFDFKYDDIKIENYISEDKLYFPLSN